MRNRVREGPSLTPGCLDPHPPALPESVFTMRPRSSHWNEKSTLFCSENTTPPLGGEQFADQRWVSYAVSLMSPPGMRFPLRFFFLTFLTRLAQLARSEGCVGTVTYKVAENMAYILAGMLRLSPRALCALVLVPLLGVVACGSSGTPAQQSTNLVTKGLAAQLAGDLSTARSDYQQAIQLNNSNKFAHYDLGTIYGRQGNITQAVQEYQTTLGLDPNFVDALFNLAVDAAVSNPPSAEQLYRKVIALQPGNASAWLNLGFVLQGEAKAAEAKTDWAKATSLDPSLVSRIPTPSPSTSAATPSPTPTH